VGVISIGMTLERFELDRTAGDGPTDTLVDALERHRPRLLAIARSLRAGDPEDLVQSTFELAIRNVGGLQRAESLWPWLVTIQAREAFRLRRRLRAAVAFGIGDGGDRGVLAGDDRDPAASADLRDALRRLPTRVRAAVVLHYMADLSVAETAAALGVSENTVKTQLKTGLRKLRESMS
jgi:DNA-directed RNA polymerase specialized sigma24 family protein